MNDFPGGNSDDIVELARWLASASGDDTRNVAAPGQLLGELKAKTSARARDQIGGHLGSLRPKSNCLSLWEKRVVSSGRNKERKHTRDDNTYMVAKTDCIRIGASGHAVYLPGLRTFRCLC